MRTSLEGLSSDIHTLDSDDQEKMLSEEERRKQNELQIGWLMHRCQALQSTAALEEALQLLIHDDPSLQERFDRLKDLGERQTMVLEAMISSPRDTSEVAWFRKHFPSDRSKPLSQEYRSFLDDFSVHPESVYQELDRLYREETVFH